MRLLVEVDAGIITGFVTSGVAPLTITLAQSDVPGTPKAEAAVLWMETIDPDAAYKINNFTGAGGVDSIVPERGGWRVPLPQGTGETVQVGIRSMWCCAICDVCPV